MATSQNTIDFIVEQIADAGDVSARKMFGEYGLYCDGKIFALVCDDQLFLKPTPAAMQYIGDFVEAPPYPGAKSYLLVDSDRWDDRDWLRGLVRASVAELPAPKPKSKAKKRP
jgi:TfoX/Sxy family transcriptional regulator of competence genes